MTLDPAEFEQIVDANYPSLYRFAFSLARQEADACDLVQETFRRFTLKHHQLRDRGRVKTWLFTTLYRVFVSGRVKGAREVQEEPGAPTHPEPSTTPDPGALVDAAAAREALFSLEEPFRSTLVLFYLEEHSYREIADILEVPMGTVMSRLSRGREMLRERLTGPPTATAPPKSLAMS
jgi:RNA polymerase sigma-70 factor (ECF subfamily)